MSSKLIVIIGSIAAAFFAWYVFLRDTAPEPLLTTQDLTVQGTEDKEVIETLLQLRTITLAGTILGDVAFLRLVDTGTQIVPEPVGRANPFVPIPRAGTSTPRTASETATTSASTRGN